MDYVDNKSNSGMKSNGWVIRVTLMSLAFVGLGMTIGFASFHIMFLTHCGGLLEEMEERHKLSGENWQTLYKEAAVKHQQCVAESRNKTDLEEIKGRLEAQTIVADRHNKLKTEHDGVKAELHKARNQDTAASQTIQKLEKQITRLENGALRLHDELGKMKEENQNQLKQISDQAKSLQDLRANKDQSSQQLSELNNANSEMKKRLDEALTNLAPFQKKIEEQVQTILELREEKTLLQEHQSTSSQTISHLRDDLKQEKHELIVCTEHLQAISTRETVQHRRQKSAKDASDSLPCVDEHEDCEVWASRGECGSNPTYMNRFCRKTCKVCPQQDNTETKWIDNEAAPTLDEEFAT